MKEFFLDISAISVTLILGERYSLYATLNVGTILQKCGCPTCEHHNDARTAAFEVGICFRQVGKQSCDEKNKKCFAIRILVANI